MRLRNNSVNLEETSFLKLKSENSIFNDLISNDKKDNIEIE